MHKPKNIIYMVDIKMSGSGRYSPNRSTSYTFSIDSWKNWANKNDVDVFISNDLIVPNEDMGICWQRYYLFDILEYNNIEYDQVLIADSDTIIHPDCPNFFNMTDNKMCGVRAECSFDWILRSIENYSKYIFDDYELKWWNYINCGFFIVNKSHKQFLKNMIDFYWNNKNKLKEIEKLYCGTDQTPLNFLIQKENVDFKFLPYQYNMIDMNRKEILKEDLIFTKCGWIYHFNCIPNNTDSKLTYYWMEKTFNYLYGSNKVGISKNI